MPGEILKQFFYEFKKSVRRSVCLSLGAQVRKNSWTDRQAEFNSEATKWQKSAPLGFFLFFSSSFSYLSVCWDYYCCCCCLVQSAILILMLLRNRVFFHLQTFSIACMLARSLCSILALLVNCLPHLVLSGNIPIASVMQGRKEKKAGRQDVYHMAFQGFFYKQNANSCFIFKFWRVMQLYIFLLFIVFIGLFFSAFFFDNIAHKLPACTFSAPKQPNNGTLPQAHALPDV